MAFSPDGRTLAAGETDGTIRLWNITGPAHPHPLSQLGHPQTGGSATRQLGRVQPRRAHAGQRQRRLGTVRLWDVADPATPDCLATLATGGGSR